MTNPVNQFCETCKKETPRCQYYPQGRSRQHGKCLECDRTDVRNARVYVSQDKRYCGECDRLHNAGPQHP